MGWILIKDKDSLPPPHEEVLVAYFYQPYDKKTDPYWMKEVSGYLYSDEYGHHFQGLTGETVSYWLALPDLPEEEEE